MRTLAVIPAKSRSVRLTGKNWRDLHGQPMTAWTIGAALGSSVIDRVVVSTDVSPLMPEDDRLFWWDRPAELYGDNVSAVQVVANAIVRMQDDYGWAAECVVMLLPTSPLRGSYSITEAVTRWKRHGTGSSVVSVIPARDIAKRLRSLGPCNRLRQIIPHGQPLWITTGAVQVTGNRPFFAPPVGFHSPQPVYPYEMDSVTGLDIDTESDWAIAKYLLEKHDGAVVETEDAMVAVDAGAARTDEAVH